MKREYIVTLHDYKDLEQFYAEMASNNKTKYVPKGSVECLNLRPTSRNTHYLLSDADADRLQKDPRVAAVILNHIDAGLELRHCFTQSSTWDKSGVPSHTGGAISNAQNNWGLYRCVNGQVTNWGSDNETGANTGGTVSLSGNISTTSVGNNVDVIIVDGHLDPSHPEFAVNSDGTGGSRVIQFNWFSLNPVVVNQSVSVYSYTPYTDMTDTAMTTNENNNHGCHVAGIVAGNTNGWARGANIYNINPYIIVGSYSINNVFDYIRNFHKTKAINPKTGKRNPTICNCSWAFVGLYAESLIQSVTYKGQTHSGPLSIAQLENMGIVLWNTSTSTDFPLPAIMSSIDADINDAIAEGIIVVVAAGNYATKIDAASGTDYNNYLTTSSGNTYYMRGGTPTTSNALVVGSISNMIDDRKAYYSNCGPIVDIFAPGSGIISSVNTGLDVVLSGSTITTPLDVDATHDSRNSAYYVKKLDGTSMACPQVTGVIACLLETYPTFNQADVLKTQAYLI